MTPIGLLPSLGREGIDTEGLGVTPEAMAKLLEVNVEGWKQQLPQMHDHHAKFGASGSRQPSADYDCCTCRSSSVSPARSRCRDCCLTPDAAVGAVPARPLLLCLLLRSSRLTVEGGRQIGAAGVLHRRADGQPWPR
jgi:hypothetical protein